MKHFVLVFDRSSGRVLREEEFSDGRTAMRERFTAEKLHRSNPDVEIVVLGAESASDLRRTHSRYFQDVGAISRRGAEVMRSARRTVHQG